MRRLTIAIGVVCVLVAASVASAATPQQIYRDFADNGRLDAKYSPSDLQRALKDAVVQGYGGPTGKNTKPTIKSGQGTKGGGAAQTPPVQSAGGLPFTGLDLALISIGGLLLLGFGAGLRRFARRAN
jgi:opacity protein-like surface antigen